MVGLKKRILHQLMAYSCCNDGDYGLYSGNGGIMLLLFEKSRELDSKPLNHYAMSILEKGICLLQQTNFSPSTMVPDPLLMGWIITEGHRRKYFDATDMEGDMAVFDEGVMHGGWPSDIPVLISYIINRYEMLRVADAARAHAFLDRLQRVIEDVIRKDDAGLVNKWIVYGLMAEKGVQSKGLTKYMDWLPGLTMTETAAREWEMEEVYLIWRMSAMTGNNVAMDKLRSWLQIRLANVDDMPTEDKIRLLERWGVTRCFFYPDKAVEDPYWEACLRTINDTDLEDRVIKRMERGSFAAREGLCSLVTVF